MSRWPPVEKPRIVGDLAFVPVGRGLEAIIDTSDLALVAGKRWTAQWVRKSWYVSHAYWKTADRASKRIYLHEAILGKCPGKQIDHKNGNGLDNRRENLRHATPTQNQQNRHTSAGKSKFKGVYKARLPGHWNAHLRIKGKMTHIGTYYCEEDAARAYDAAAREHFGEFANCNFPACVSDTQELQVEIVGA